MRHEKHRARPAPDFLVLSSRLELFVLEAGCVSSKGTVRHVHIIGLSSASALCDRGGDSFLFLMSVIAGDLPALCGEISAAARCADRNCPARSSQRRFVEDRREVLEDVWHPGVMSRVTWTSAVALVARGGRVIEENP